MIRGIICALVLIIGCSRGDRVTRQRGVRNDTASQTAVRGDTAMRGDSGSRRDTATVHDAALPEDPPCFASHLGLPCQ
jgi:hypothetical protein